MDTTPQVPDLKTLTLEEKVGQLLMVGFNGLDAPSYILDWLAKGQIGGIILFARNVASPEQLARLTDQLHQAAKYPILIGIDQEGGTVARLREGFTESPGAMALAAAQTDETLAEQMNRVLATEMRAVGINWTFAPAVDISYNADNPTVGTRSFGNDPEQVSQMAVAAVRGFQAGGVAACAKHFPGLGNTAVDTHLALATVDAPVEQLLTTDLMPYHAGAAADLATVMTTHTIFSTLDPDYPATLSPVIVRQLLRDKLGFNGVVTTDCMEMKAISDHYPPDESAVLAVLAGIDIVLVSHTQPAQQGAYVGLLAAAQSGRLPETVIDAAVERIIRLKHRYPAHRPDLSQIRTTEHLEVAQKAARAGVVLLRDSEHLLPVESDGTGMVLVEFASQLDSIAVESGDLTGLAAQATRRFPKLTVLTISARDTEASLTQKIETARLAAVLVVATRNAHLHSGQRDIVARLVEGISRWIVIALRNPYDAELFPDARTILCTCGDSAPSLAAAVDALAGDYQPDGRLPVKLNYG